MERIVRSAPTSTFIALVRDGIRMPVFHHANNILRRAGLMREVPMELFKGDPTPFLITLNDPDTLMVSTIITV